MTATTVERTAGPSSVSYHASDASTLCARVEAEFVEMPGLTLTLPQAARLWGVTLTQSRRVLSDLVEARFLTRDARGSYRRRGCPRCS